MDDVAYKNALARKSAIEEELKEINYFLEMHQRFSALSGRNHDSQPDFILVSPSRGTTVMGEVKRLSKKLGPSEFADLAEKYIESAGHPLTRTELVTAFEVAGVDLPSPDKARYLGTILWRHRQRFPNVPGRGYTTKSLLTPAERERIEQSLRSTDITESARITLDHIASVHAKTNRNEADEIIDAWEAGQQIPSETDRHMLASARHALGGVDLSIQEKRYLRQRLVDIIRGNETA